MSNVPPGEPERKWPGLQTPPSDPRKVKKWGRIWWEAKYSRTCPVCGRLKLCLVRPDEAICSKWDSEVVVEFSDGNEGYWHPLTFESMVEGPRRPYRGLDWTPGKSTFELPSAEPVVSPQAEDNLAPVEVRDRVYRALLQALGLSDQHRKALLARGLSEAAITRKGYASLKSFDRLGIAEEVMDAVGLDSLLGIPGFYMRQFRGGISRWNMDGLSGLLIPFRDEQGRIPFMQLRPDMEEGMSSGSSKRSKYFSFSSNPSGGSDKGSPRLDGTKASLMANVASPGRLNANDKRIWITEGGLKADVAAEFLNEIVVGIPGVTMWRHALAALQRVLPDKAGEIVVAMDQDKDANKQVRRAELALIGALQANGYRVSVAEWDTDESGSPKGIDDLLALGRSPRICPPPAKESAPEAEVVEGPRIQECPPPTWLLQTSTDARSVHFAAGHLTASLIRAINPARRGRAELLVRQDPFGVGKTTAVVKVLRAKYAVGWPQVKRGKSSKPMRVCVLVDSSREQEAKGTIKKGEDLVKQIGAGAVYLAGRNPKNCGRMNEVQALGVKGHNIMSALCMGCQKYFRSESHHGKEIPDFIRLDGAPGEVCAYLRSKKEAEELPIHVAHKNTVLNESRRAEHYDVLVVDEGLANCLLKFSTIDEEDLNTWLINLQGEVSKLEADCLNVQQLIKGRMNFRLHRFQTIREHVEAIQRLRSIRQHAQLCQLLQQCLQPPASMQKASAVLPLVQALEQAGIAQGVDAKALLQRCLHGDYREEKGVGCFRHERPDAGGASGKLPLRAWRDLLEALGSEFNAPNGDHFSYVIWKKLGHLPIKAIIELRRPRHRLIETLRKKSVVNTDATPDLERLRRLFRTRVETVPVRENVLVVQCHDGAFGKSATSKKLPKRVVQLARYALEQSPDWKVGVLTHKDTLSELKWIDDNGQPVKTPLCDSKNSLLIGHERLVLGYWGRDERATNTFASCQILIVSGLHMPPIEIVEREVQAWRRALALPRPDNVSGKLVFLTYGYADEDGVGRCCRCPRVPDPDVDAELSRIWAANVRQAIGRLRATRSSTPKLVVLDCDRPVDGLRLDGLGTLTTVTEQPDPLRQQSAKNKSTAQARHLSLKELLRPLNEVLTKHYGRRPTLAEFHQASAAFGHHITEWDARRALAALNPKQPEETHDVRRNDSSS